MKSPSLLMTCLVACLFWSAAAPTPAQITATGPDVTEGDSAPVDAVFAYTLPATAAAASYDWALLPHRLAAGRDFRPWQATTVQPAGPAVNGTVTVPVLPDFFAEETGRLTLVARPPGAATWAAALSAPAVVPEFTGANAMAEVLFWQDGAVVSRRLVAGISYLDTWQRTPSGTMILTSTLQAPSATPTLFHDHYPAASDRAVVISQPSGLLTWLRDVSAPGGWKQQQTLPAISPSTLHLAGDRLFLSMWNRFAVYRLDATQPAGWRQTGMAEADQLFHLGEDSIFVNQGERREIWGRSRGTEDLWNPAYRSPSGAAVFPVGSAEGMVLLASAERVDIMERSADQQNWAKTGALNIPREPDESVLYAVAGDWIAAARIKNQSAGTTGARIQLLLRQATDRTQWAAAGEFDAPEAGPNTRIFWDRGELVLLSFNNNTTSTVTTRRFPGGGIKVQDDDRAKLTLAAAVQYEPESGSSRAECYAEFPLPVLADTTVRYEFTGGTALAGQDFTGTGGTALIPAGSSRVLIPITLLADSQVEPDETLGIRLTIPGQAAVEAVLVIRDTNPVPVLMARATPLLEGYLGSEVTVRQTAAAGSSLPVVPLDVHWKSGGFASPTAQPPLAAAGTDLPDGVVSQQLSAAVPERSFSLVNPDQP